MEQDSPTAQERKKSLLNSNEGDLSTLVISDTPISTHAEQASHVTLHTQEADKSLSASHEISDDEFGDFGNFSTTVIEMFPTSELKEDQSRFSRFSAHLSNQDIKNIYIICW